MPGDTYYGYVLYCKSLDGNAACGSVTNEDVLITVNDNENTASVTEVKTSPNNLRSDSPAWYSDLWITFTLAEGMPYYSGSKIKLDVPSSYVLNQVNSEDDKFHCFPNFAATCVLGSSSIEL